AGRQLLLTSPSGGDPLGSTPAIRSHLTASGRQFERHGNRIKGDPARGGTVTAAARRPGDRADVLVCPRNRRRPGRSPRRGGCPRVSMSGRALRLLPARIVVPASRGAC